MPFLEHVQIFPVTDNIHTRSNSGIRRWPLFEFERDENHIRRLFPQLQSKRATTR